MPPNKKAKIKKISDSQQRVAVDFLEQLGFCQNVQEVAKIYKDLKEKYQICDDPFTGLPCTLNDYLKNSQEYDRQKMEQLYGHHDGLD